MSARPRRPGPSGMIWARENRWGHLRRSGIEQEDEDRRAGRKAMILKRLGSSYELSDDRAPIHLNGAVARSRVSHGRQLHRGRRKLEGHLAGSRGTPRTCVHHEE